MTRREPAEPPTVLGRASAGRLDERVRRVVRQAAVTDVATRLSGGRGYGSGSRLARRLRDARAAHLMSPTTDLKTWLGRSLLGLPLL